MNDYHETYRPPADPTRPIPRQEAAEMFEAFYSFLKSSGAPVPHRRTNLATTDTTNTHDTAPRHR